MIGGLGAANRYGMAYQLQPQEENPKDYYYDPAKDPDMDPRVPVAGIKPRTFFLTVGVFMLAMLLMIPLWNALYLLQDEVYGYMLGESIPIDIICICGGVLVLYIIAVSLFFGTTRAEVQSEHSIMLIVSIFITLLGVLLMLVSFPLRNKADSAYQEIWANCGYGTKSQPLTQEWELLATLRAQPACAAELSVETCAGYAGNREAKVLKYMENTYRCSGFCVQESNVHVPLANATATSFIQTSSRVASRAMSMLQIQEATKEEQVPGQPPPETPLEFQYPSTLFSKANYQSSCDGMSARNLRNFVQDVGLQIYYEGLVLVMVAIFIQVLKLLGFCIGKPRPDGIYKVPESAYYGTTRPRYAP